MAEEPSKEEQEEYIDFLHDRIQFLEEELTESQKTVLELRQQGRTLNDEKGSRRREAVEGLDETRDAVEEVHNKVRDTLDEMRRVVDDLPDPPEREDPPEDLNWNASEKRRQDLADQVSQYESSAGGGSSPGDHV